jgi:hypothetical protein
MTRDTALSSGDLGVYLQWYRQSFAPAGLVRSGTWAVLAMGIVSLTAALMGLANRGPHTNRRQVVIGLALLLPCLLFWLPAPTPIMRHYYVASLGVAWLVAASGVINRPGARGAVAVAAVCLLNLGVPELLYAGYHVTHPGERKTPHGTFFAAHVQSAARLKRLAALRREVIQCGMTDGAPGPRVIALATWEVSSHLFYQLGVSGAGLQRLVTSSIYPGVPMTRCVLQGGGDVRIIRYTYFQDPVLQRAANVEIDRVRRDGACAAAPAALADALPALDDPAGPVIRYDLDATP